MIISQTHHLLCYSNGLIKVCRRIWLGGGTLTTILTWNIVTILQRMFSSGVNMSMQHVATLYSGDSSRLLAYCQRHCHSVVPSEQNNSMKACFPQHCMITTQPAGCTHKVNHHSTSNNGHVVPVNNSLVSMPIICGCLRLRFAQHPAVHC